MGICKKEFTSTCIGYAFGATFMNGSCVLYWKSKTDRNNAFLNLSSRSDREWERECRYEYSTCTLKDCTIYKCNSDPVKNNGLNGIPDGKMECFECSGGQCAMRTETATLPKAA